MNTIAELIVRLKREWSTPRTAVHQGKECPLKLVCEFGEPTELGREHALYKPLSHTQLPEFWTIASSAGLFRDAYYSQWGLKVLNPEATVVGTKIFASERPREYRRGDLVFAEFYGDSEIAILRTDPVNPDFGTVIIGLPLDPRKEWPLAATTFGEFIYSYAECEGDKYWL